MTIGISDGQQHDSWSDFYLSPYHKELSEDINPSSFNIDRNHHVPLVASAILDEKGNPTGDLAIDHRIPSKPEYEPYLHLHEMSETFHMNNLMKSGMNALDAYHEAHDKIATPIESAAVRADLGEDGQEAYKQFWREAASIAKEPTDKGRHPMAHTTVHGLDEGEGIKLAMAGEGDEPTLLTGQPADPPGQSPEESLHRKQEEAPFAMTRVLGGGRGSPVMPAANQNVPVLDRINDKLKSGESIRDMPRQELEKAQDQILSNPYRKALDEQMLKGAKDRLKPKLRVITPETKSSADQLRDWFLGKDKE